MDRIQTLIYAAKLTGLDQVLKLRPDEARMNEEPVYSKLFVDSKNRWTIRSVEVWYPSTKEPYFKVTHGDQITGDAMAVIDSIATAPGLKLNSQPMNSQFEGSWIAALAVLASVLANDAGEVLQL